MKKVYIPSTVMPLVDNGYYNNTIIPNSKWVSIKPKTIEFPRVQSIFDQPSTANG